MAINFNDVASYAYKLGIYDIEQAIALAQEGKLPPAKLKALEDTAAYAHKNGIKDFLAESYNYYKEKPSAEFKQRYMKYALENDMTPGQAVIDMLKEKNDTVQTIREEAEASGEPSQPLVNDFINQRGDEVKQRAETQAEDQRNRKLQKLSDIGRGFYESPAYHQKYWKGVTGDKKTIESDPFFGSDAFKENVAKYSPAAITHREDTLSALNKSDYYKNLENMGRQQRPERELYNNMLQQYQYEQARRNPLNILTGRYEYLRPQSYGPENSWVTSLRNKLGFNPVTSFDQKG